MSRCSELLRLVLPQHGVYCLTYPQGNRWINQPIPDLDTLEKVGMANAQHTDVYFALSSYQEQPGKFRRVADYALYQRAVWLDLDCDATKAQSGKAYATQVEASQALARFLKATELPVPAIVNSGYGFHLYWAFTTGIATANWRVIAKTLAEVCNKYGLLVDHHRTRDVASVLRMPMTINHKYGATRKVEVVHCPAQGTRVEDFLRTLLNASGIQTTNAPVVPKAPEGLSFSDSFTKPYENNIPLSWHNMILECKQIREMGKGSYPEWMLAARTLLHTVQGEQVIHELSKLDAKRYSQEQTQRLIDSLKQDPSIGPGLCESFCDRNSALCANCPHRGKIKTPLQLCKPDAPKPVIMPAVDISKADLEQGEIALGDATHSIEVTPYQDKSFQVQPGKGIFKLVPSSEDPESVIPVRIAPFELYIHTLCIDNTLGSVPKRTYLMRKIVPGCAPVDIPFALEDALGSQKIEIWAGQCGILPAPKYKKEFFTFMNTYIASVQNKLPEVYVRNHFGWETCVDKTTGKKYDGFIVGDTMYSQHGTSRVRLDERSASVASKLGSKGSLEKWKEVPKLYKTLDQKFAQLLMCTAFGAPLMKFGKGTATNIAYNFWDIAGGKGKSSMLQAIASVWGDPHQMLMGRTDTHAARFQQYAVYRNLPILIDELTGIDDAELSSMLYDIVNGREKSRSTSSGTGLARSGQWDTITIFTANQSMYEALRDYRSQTSATCMRLIECVCDFKDYTNTPMASRINHAMTMAQENFGLAGAYFIDFILKHPESIRIITRDAEKFAIENAKSADERFWLYGIAIPLLAGRVACALGLLDYDMDALTYYCIDELLPSLRRKVKSNKPTGRNMLADFLNDNLDSTLIVQAHTRSDLARVEKEQGLKPSSFQGGIVDRFVVQIPSRKLLIRRELDTNTVFISTRALRDWCKQKCISLDVLLNDLVRQGFTRYGITPKRFVLASDIADLPQVTQTVYKFDLKEEALVNVR